MTVSARKPPRQPLRDYGRNFFEALKILSQPRGCETGQEVENLSLMLGFSCRQTNRVRDPKSHVLGLVSSMTS